MNDCLESGIPDILASWKANLGDSMDSNNFSLEDIFMHGFSVSMKEGIHFARNLSFENSWGFFFKFSIGLPYLNLTTCGQGATVTLVGRLQWLCNKKKPL